MLPDYSFDDPNHERSDLLLELDDNGFPFPPEEEEEEKEGSFAADFYRCGTDWSSLVRNDRKLKQANLFQMWGGAGAPKKPRLHLHQGASFPKPNHAIASLANPKSSSSTVSNRPRVCPFYKKIPGSFFFFFSFHLSLS